LAVCRGPNAEASSVAASSLATLVQMVAAGMGVTLLPASAAALEARPGNGIAVRRFRSPAPSRTIGLTWRRSSPNRAMFAGLATLLRPALSLS
jgi:LysR family hydrogen peroxide-inducible transcriptional activator